MKNYIEHDAWRIVERGFHAQNNEITESLMSLGNGRMGGRANFEEGFTGKTLQGNYVAGVWFPDKTRVGWWKNGYPRYFAKVINACNWIGIGVEIEGQKLDLAICTITEFSRVLDMQNGLLTRSFVATLQNGNQIKVEATRFCSIVDDEAGVIKYALTPLNFDEKITLTPFLDGDVSNKDSNYDQQFWQASQSAETKQANTIDEAYLAMQTKDTPFKTQLFTVCTGMKVAVEVGGKRVDYKSENVENEKFVAKKISIDAQKNQEVVIYKYAANLSTLNYSEETLIDETKAYIKRISDKGFEQLKTEHSAAWKVRWEQNDIEIEGDIAAQQGIRFNIFQLQQTYTGEDQRLNIGPKGFTGEKYGGSTYWDTEAYCLPFYLSTSDPKVARNLLIYRHKQLQKAIENAEMLGFKNGAALYPMVTMTGEECHNEWEITFEEIHRNGAIAYAIYDYVRYTGDTNYLEEYGLDVLIAICRFWAQRVNWSSDKSKYVMLGVTGPNEYENNVNNNFYTNYLAAWCLRYTLSVIKGQGSSKDLSLSNVQRPTSTDELSQWQHIVENMYYPYDETRQVFLQQDGFLDKELLTVDDITEHRPINQKWSWDRILRSCFIKQADVLQCLYFFEDEFDADTLRRNFDFYEPMTVHESSLSPCIHVIQAAKLGLQEKAYQMYLRTSRLDLDDYNNDTEDGLHITSMAGTWLSVIKGFAGMRVADNTLTFNPFLPEKWTGYSFRIGFRGSVVKISVHKSGVEVKNLSDRPIDVVINENLLHL